MHDVEVPNVLLAVHDDTSTAHVATTSDHNDVASVEFDEVGDLVRLELELDGVVNLDQRVGVADGAAIVGDDVRNALGAKRDLLDLKEFVGSLLRGDAVDGETALDIVKETEVLVGLLNRDDIFCEI